ncbi:cylicin-1 isoform X2 [Aotus nancymaae]|uniref:cylicin-1 isoform X2 n=1 Tax=Aotus nancymaae TaxID=37293 RepID=UPI0030FE00D6
MSPPRLEVNIRTYDNSIPISESSRKSWNEKHFASSFPKPPQRGRNDKSRPLKSQVTVTPEAPWIHKLL